MSLDILMPALSPTMEEGSIARWLVKPGDRVEPGQVIAEIETDKATMDVEAVEEGILAELLFPEGTQGVKVNTPIARLDTTGAHAPQHSTQVPAPRRTPPQAPEPKPAAAPVEPPPQHANGATQERILASPLARRMAAQAGIDLGRLRGTGPNGRIVRADVEAAVGSGPGPALARNAAETALQRGEEASRALALPTASPPPQEGRPTRTLAQMGIPDGTYRLVPLDGMRRTVARRMTESFRDVPHFPLTIDVEIDRLLSARAELNARLEQQGVKLSVNDLIIKACALGLMRVPESNASYTPEGIAYHHHADVAVAVAMEGGLITPIVRGAESKGLAQISIEMADLAARARARKLKPEEYQGGTFSLSNLGMMGIKAFASILNEPHGMILSVGAGEKRPVVRGDQLAIATVMTVTLTCDHRVVDGSIGAAFLKAFRGFLEDPMSMLL